MKDLNILTNEELIEECNKELVNENTLYLWFELELEKTGLLIGNWFWSDSAYKLYLCYNKNVLRAFLLELFDSDVINTDELSVLELIDLYERHNGVNICMQSLRNTILSVDSIDDYEVLSKYVIETTKQLSLMGIQCETYVCDNFDDVINYMGICNGGVLPVYDTKEEYLINDYYG